MNNLIKFLVFIMVFTMSFGLFAPVNAATVAVNLGVGAKADPLDFTLPVENQSDAEVLAGNLPTNIYITYDAGAEFATNDTVVIAATAGLAIADCGTTDADQNGVNDGAAVVLGQDYTYTFTGSTAQAASSVTFCITVSQTVPASTAGNYSFIMADALGNFGGAFLYVQHANDVTVTATVEGAILEFWIRDAADTTNLATCALGILTTTAVSTCNYALKVRTTATNGYVISWTSDGGLDNAAHTATIDAVAVNNEVTIGVEEYGVTFTPGTNTDGGTCSTAANIWSAGYDDPVSTTAQSLVWCDKANLPDPVSGLTAYVHNMDHQASISPATPAGSYDQIVSYYVTAYF